VNLYSQIITILFSLSIAFSSISNSELNSNSFNYFADESGQVFMSINILGHVNSPGSYIVQEGSNIFDILAAAGGYKTGAKLNQIYLYRKNGEKIKINLNLLIHENKKIKINFKPNDTIYVASTVSYNLIQNSSVLNIVISLLNLFILIESS